MYEEKKKKEIFKNFSKEESNKRLINTIVIKIYSKRRTSKEVSIELC